MARTRFIKPTFYDDERLSEISIEARYLYIGLWGHIDRSGFIEYGPKFFKKAVFPYDDRIGVAEVERFVYELINAGRLIPCEFDQKRFLFCPTFQKHQHFHHKEKAAYNFEKPEASPSLTLVWPHTDPTAISYQLSAISYQPQLSAIGYQLSASAIVSKNEKKKPQARKSEANPGQVSGSKVWEAYSKAYETKYGVLPVRNAKTNTLCKRFVERVGDSEAPAIAEFYVSHRNQFYVQTGHSLEFLVRDAEKLRTEWVTGIRITNSKSRTDDLHENNVQAIREHLASKAEGK